MYSSISVNWGRSRCCSCSDANERCRSSQWRLSTPQAYICAVVVVWSTTVKSSLETIKYLVLRSHDPLGTKFCCGFVQDTVTEATTSASGLGLSKTVFVFPRRDRLMWPLTPESELIVYTLGPQTSNCNEPSKMLTINEEPAVVSSTTIVI